MRFHKTLAAALMLAALAPAAADAQQLQVIRQSRGMLGIMTQPVPADDGASRQRVVLDVVPDSPAERAGVQRGDTITAVNGLAATQQLMSAGFEPGDTVVLRIRRAGRTHEIPVEVAERGGSYFMTTDMLNDSVRGRINIIMRDVRAHADTLGRYLPRIMGDSTLFFGLGDSAAVFRYYGLRDTLNFSRAHIDSVRARVFRFSEELPRMFSDSLAFYAPSREWNDSIAGRWRAFTDSAGVWRPAEVFTSSLSFGTRAVAGAELSELNEGLAEYFGTTDGVLVLKAPEGTPAARAGIRSGDVIVRANGIDVSSITDLRRAIEAAARGSDIEVHVLRRGRNVELMLRRE